MRAYYCINKNYENVILVMTLKFSHNAQFFGVMLRWSMSKNYTEYDATNFSL